MNTFKKTEDSTLQDGKVVKYTKSAHGQDGCISASKAGILIEGRFCISSPEEYAEFEHVLVQAAAIAQDEDAYYQDEEEEDYYIAMLDSLVEGMGGVKAVANELGVSRKTIYRWRTGKRNIDDVYCAAIESLYEEKRC